MIDVKLRPVKSSDVDWIFEACQDRQIQRWTLVPRPYTREHALEFVSGSTGFFARWVIETANSGQPVGMISIHEIEDSCASIGYWIAPQCRGRGLTTTAVCLVCEEIEGLRSESGSEVDAVRAFVARDNRASRRAVEKAGFELVKEQHGPAVENLVPVETCVYLRTLRDQST